MKTFLVDDEKLTWSVMGILNKVSHRFKNSDIRWLHHLLNLVPFLKMMHLILHK